MQYSLASLFLHCLATNFATTLHCSRRHFQKMALKIFLSFKFLSQRRRLVQSKALPVKAVGEEEDGDDDQDGDDGVDEPVARATLEQKIDGSGLDSVTTG